MDVLHPRMLSFPPDPLSQSPLSDQEYDAAIREQIEVLKKLDEAKFFEKTTGGDNLLDVIDPALNTVTYTYILMANIRHYHKHHGKDIDIDSLWGQLTNFLSVFDPRQIRYLGEALCSIIMNVAEMARGNNKPGLAVPPIRNALLRLDPSGSMLTSNHLVLIKLALESGSYMDVTPVIDKFILYFPGFTDVPRPKYLCDMSLSPAAFLTPTFKLSDNLRYQSILEYFLWSAMVHMGLHRWESALQCLESVITYPTIEWPSKIMTEAYKKWVLVGLVHQGRLLRLPKSTSVGPATAYHIIGKHYETLANIFENGTASRLKAEVDAAMHIWKKDANYGLVMEVLEAFQRFQIRGLTQVYSKISIPEILNQTTNAVTGSKLPTPQACEDLVRAMIHAGDLQATLSNPPSGPSILTFLPPGPALTEAQMQKELVGTSARIQALTEKIKQTDRMLTHDRDYIKFVHKQKRAKAARGGNDDHDVAQTSDWDDINDDEDIMGDGGY
ncbi:hypothetical protein LZ554_007565 [Drepanopeziza brunnea f. sp. 'monogermtubi']|nr:hypothetical protein LZ554_007565 [Drepanopeziza brunnea f. sp. 'monogermtubi']